MQARSAWLVAAGLEDDPDAGDTVNDIAEAMQCSRSTAIQRINRMVKLGKAVKSGKAWETLSDGRKKLVDTYKLA